jgi:gas vesicle protein
MRNREGGDASFLLGLMLGVFVGAAIAMVLAPQPGEETRAMLSDKARKAGNTAQDKADEAKERIEGAAEGAAE